MFRKSSIDGQEDPSTRCCSPEAGSVSPCVTITRRKVERYSPGTSCQAACQERSEEHTSELQSPDHLVCRLLLEKKKRSSAVVELVEDVDGFYLNRLSLGPGGTVSDHSRV